MSAVKRKAPSSTSQKQDKKQKQVRSVKGNAHASVKQARFTGLTIGESEREAGWLWDQVAEERQEKKDLKFNKSRMRFLSLPPGEGRKWSDCLSSTKKMKPGSEGVLYWMNRDQRIQDNWAMIYAQKLARSEELPLHICFCLDVPQDSEVATIRHYGFLLRGLEEVAKDCVSLDIQFHLLQGSPGEVLPGLVADFNLGAVVCDFSPLRTPLQWLEDVKKGLPEDIPFMQVDAHNVVPCWVASNKLEYSARTIRGKITKLLPEYHTEFPPVDKHPHKAVTTAKPVDWEETLASLQVDRTVEEADWAKPGAVGGWGMLENFIELRLTHFATHNNDPNCDALSRLSPWIRFGQLSAQRVALQVQKLGRKSATESVHSYCEQLVVRRELSDNFCYYNKNYDNIKGAYEWAQKTLKDHAKDKREWVYTREQLEKCQTHDKLWNAAQYQVVTEGKMHGFMRMYWAKKILEWTSSPEEALAIAIYLNDRYELDGQDPNGFVGCMWSICGVHDQGWGERPIFGKIRYMNYAGCKRKFDVAQFEDKYRPKSTKKA